jgi:hypothetical protein
MVMYVGIKNPIAISVSDIPNNHLKIKLSDTLCEIEKVNDNNYLITPKGGLRLTLIVTNEQNGINEIIDSTTFRVKRVPSPDVLLCTMKPGAINKNIIAANPVIYVLRPAGFDIAVTFKLVEYTLTIQNKSKQSFQNKGRVLPDEQIALIKEMKSGETLIISDIIVEAPEGNRKLDSEFVYTIL